VTGQKPIVTIARKSVASFHLREGMEIGCKVTLRGKRMWEFFDRLVSVAIPRVRDFRGMKATAFDGRGNYSLGLTEQILFPEINIDSVKNDQGMDVTVVTSSPNDEGARALLKALGFPFERPEEKRR
jgi:large subunit ribosomal protein L5